MAKKKKETLDQRIKRNRRMFGAMYEAFGKTNLTPTEARMIKDLGAKPKGRIK